MSSYHSSGPRGSQDLGQKLGQNMAEKYRCKIGGEWKPMSGFSKKQQKLVQDKLDRHARVNRANTGMVCRIHSGEPVNEIPCEGPCDEIKTLDQFSKNNRTNGVNICKSCQHWINTQEPGYTPWAGPNTQQDLLEDSDEYDARLPTDPSEIFDFNSEVDTPLAPITGTNGIATMDENDLQTGFQSLGLETRQSYAGGPLGLAARNYLNGGRNAPVSLLDSESIASAATSAILGTTDTAATRINNPFLDINYNAYDSTGQKHLKTKTPTTQAGSSSMSSSMKATSSRTQANEGGRSESGPNATVFTTSSVAPSGPWPGNRQGDRKQLTNKEHRELQKGKPSRVFNPIPYGDDDEYSDDE